jgi:hypothetical protein
MKGYRPLPNYLTIKESRIEGLGLYAKENVISGYEIGITHVKDVRFETGLIRTPLGGFINHSEQPNCKWYIDGDLTKVKTIRDIQEGEELTLKYVLYDVEKKNTEEGYSDDVNIFGKISGPQYKELIEGYQSKSGEEFNEWYKSLPNEERVFLSSMFD